jgi:hypothetical protein
MPGLAAVRAWATGLVFACVVAGASADVIPGDRAALVDLYNATGGPGWTNHTGWTTATDVCDWYGVDCSSCKSRVTMLCAAAGRVGARTARSNAVTCRSLCSNNLSGTIPSSVGALTALTAL